MFSKSLDIAMFALLERFGRQSWLILAHVGPQKDIQTSLKRSQNQSFGRYLGQFWDNLGIHSGDKIVSKKETQNWTSFGTLFRRVNEVRE